MWTLLTGLYRRWLRLLHRGMAQTGSAAFERVRRAEAIGLLSAMAPMLLLVTLDPHPAPRGALWNVGFAVAAVWAALVGGVMLWGLCASLVRVCRDYDRRRTGKS